jgi:hypothetical protein
MNGNNSNHEQVGLFQLVVLVLSVVVLGALFADTAFKLPAQISNVLQTVDTLVCILLLSGNGAGLTSLPVFPIYQSFASGGWFAFCV